MASQPFGLGANRHYLRGRGRGRGDRAGKRGGENAVGLVVTTRAGANVQTPAASESSVFDAGKIVRTLQRPAAEAVFKAAIGDEVRSVVDAHLDFVQQTFAQSLHDDDDAVID